MRVRSKLSKSTVGVPEEKPTTQLTDLTVEEVSLVDRAATRRTFLIVKNAPPETPAEKPAAMKITASDKAKLVQKLAAARAAMEAVGTVLETAEEAEGVELPKELQDSIEKVGKLFVEQPQTPAVPQQPEVTAKAGKKFSAANEAKLRDAQKLLNELLGGAEEPKEEEDDEPVAAAKADESATLQAIASLADTVDKLVTAAKVQKGRLDQLESSTAGSRQVSKADDVDSPAPPQKEYSWPLDMTQPRTRENTPPEKSFFT